MEITDSACVPTFSYPFALDCHQYYELMVAQGEGRSPMTSADAETDSKPIIIIIIIYKGPPQKTWDLILLIFTLTTECMQWVKVEM